MKALNGRALMKTEVMMQRHLTDGIVVRQSNQTEMFNVTDLIDGFNEWRKDKGLPEKPLWKYWENDSTKESIEALDVLENQTTKKGGLLKKVCRGKDNKGTWVHPAIFVDIAMWLNPEFKARVMIWLADNLLGARNSSGLQYGLMTRALVDKFPMKTSQWLILRMGNRIRDHILGEGQDWNNATTAQLEERLALQSKIMTACELLDDGISEEEFCKKVFRVKELVRKEVQRVA